MKHRAKKIWGEATALWQLGRRISWIDLVFLIGLAGMLAGVISMLNQSGHAQPTAIDIELSPWALPKYTFYSLMRGVVAYVCSLTFTLLYGYWAAKDRLAEKVLVPLLDILQSIPLLGFMPGIVLAMVRLFPDSRIGLELAAILLIFTSQVWNMTFSFYHSLRSVPKDMSEVGTVYRFTWWQRFKWVELPFATVGLAWNSMMSMAGGWFFLMISEAFVLGNDKYWLPGLGSYMTRAVNEGDTPAMIYAVVAMVLMIVVLDQLIWRPLVVWAQKFRMEDTSGGQDAMSSWFLEWLQRMQLIGWMRDLLRKQWDRGRARLSTAAHLPGGVASAGQAVRGLSLLLFAVLLGLLAFSAYNLTDLLVQVSWADWQQIVGNGMITLGRVLAAILLGTLWTLPVGLAIGLHPKLSRICQPIMQVLASFPAPMLYPLVAVLMQALGVSLNWGSIFLMLLGTQWYILFNIIAGASAIPGDLREVARHYHFSRWQRFTQLYLPGIYPYLVTAWVTAAGGAWNASIVAEYMQGQKATGLGRMISEASASGSGAFPILAASLLAMSVIVFLFNRLVWRRCYRLAEERYAIA